MCRVSLYKPPKTSGAAQISAGRNQKARQDLVQKINDLESDILFRKTQADTLEVNIRKLKDLLQDKDKNGLQLAQIIVENNTKIKAQTI